MSRSKSSTSDKSADKPKSLIWSVRQWCRDADNMSPTRFYRLPLGQRPRMIELAGVARVAESPQAWRDRLVAEQSGAVEAADVVG